VGPSACAWLLVTETRVVAPGLSAAWPGEEAAPATMRAAAPHAVTVVRMSGRVEPVM
jgi:hypothetical protein